MSAVVLQPPEIPHVCKAPVIFLAGPIQGAPPWQAIAVEYIRSHSDGITIANPRRDAIEKLDERGYEKQVEWEHLFLQAAITSGVVMFWLAAEGNHDCSRAYAQTTRFELGEAMVRHSVANARVVVGVEAGFSGAQYIKKTLRDKTPRIPVLSSLEETCAEAIRLASPPNT